MLANSARGVPPFQEEGWVAVGRECNSGNSGEVDLCSSPSCTFCDVVRNGFQWAHCPAGFTVSFSPASANEHLRVTRSVHSAKALFLVSIASAAGSKVPEATAQQLASRGFELRKESALVESFMSLIMVKRRR